MTATEGAATFQATGVAYRNFMGRYSEPLAAAFADWVGVVEGQSALDVGCGPGALTGVLVDRLGTAAVSACDPSPPFVADFAARFPEVEVRAGAAESIPYDDEAFDLALAQLVLHFVSDAPRAVSEMRRVVRPGGTVGACVWDFAEGMEMLRHFWDAALSVDPDAPDEARTLHFSREGEIAELFTAAGLVDVAETTISVVSRYRDFDELWSGFLAGIGPAGAFCVGLAEADRSKLHANLFERLGSPTGGFALDAMARSVSGRVPA